MYLHLAHTVLADTTNRNLNLTGITSAIPSRSTPKRHGKRCLAMLLVASMSAITLGWCARASAATVSGLYNTGVSSGATLFTGGGVLPNDTIVDPHYQLISAPFGTMVLRTMTSADANFPPDGWGTTAHRLGLGPRTTSRTLSAVSTVMTGRMFTRHPSRSRVAGRSRSPVNGLRTITGSVFSSMGQLL